MPRSTLLCLCLLLLPTGYLLAQQSGPASGGGESSAQQDAQPAEEVDAAAASDAASAENKTQKKSKSESEQSPDDQPREPKESQGTESEAPADEKGQSEPAPSAEAEKEKAQKPQAAEGNKEAAKPETDSKEKSDRDKEAESSKQEEPAADRLPVLGYTDTPRLPGQPWRVHDLVRPRPRVIKPGEFGQPVGPPSDAVVLFDGTDLSQWCHREIGKGKVELYAPQWILGEGYFEVEPDSGDLQTIDTFGSCQLHIEWAAPEDVSGASQERGQSGVVLMGAFELQILDSFNNRTYADGQAGALYGQYPPKVNVSREPGEWQTYDIIFEAPRFDDDELVEPAYVTLIHNGAVVHHRREFLGNSVHKEVPNYEPMPPAGPLVLQDNGSANRFRNIWIRPLED